MSAPSATASPRARAPWARAIAPLFVGALLGFIGGYFAGGGGRPGPAPDAATSPGGTDRIATLKADLQRDRESPRLWAALGNAYYDREDWDHAIEAYEKALRKAPKDANVLSDLGAAFRNRGEFRRAVASFERARSADPDHWQSLLNLVLIHAYDLHDSAGAQKWLDELKRRYPEIPDLDRIQDRISALRAS